MADYLIQKETAEVLANQIRRITGTENQYNIAEVAEILSRIEGNVVEAAGDLRMLVVDYDGTVLKEANLSEGQAFALPDPPSHEGLKFTEWVSCVPVKNNMVVANQADILVCPMYETISGATEIYVTVSDATDSVYIGRLYGSEIAIDWGDGNTETQTPQSGGYVASHTYSAAGNYVVKIAGAYGIMGDYSTDRSEITKIHLSSEFTLLRNYAFKNCKNMTSLTMTKNIKEIQGDAFYDCYSLIQFIAPLNCEITDEIYINSSDALKYVVMPYGLTNNKLLRFDLTQLEMLTLPETITTMDTEIFPVFATSLDAYAHLTYEEDGLYYIPSHTNKKFAVCGADKSIMECDVSDAIVLGSGALRNCTLMTSVTLPATLSKIPNRFFSGCEALSSIYLPDTVLELGDSAFYRCEALSTIDLKNVEKVGEYALNYTGITSLIIPESLTEIGYMAFSYMESLTSVIINSNPIMNDDESSFTGYWFSHCPALSNITLSEDIKTIGKGLFFDCPSITNLDFLSNITTIYQRAFERCTGLTSINIPSSVIDLRDSDANFQNPFAGCSNVETIAVDAANPNYYSDGHCIINRSSKFLVSGCKNSVIPDGIVTIGDNAFDGMGITTVTLPSTVTRLEMYSFRNCTNLASITIPKSVTNIGYAAFEGCTGLTTAVYEGTEEEWANVTINSGNTALTDIITFAG